MSNNIDIYREIMAEPAGGKGYPDIEYAVVHSVSGGAPVLRFAGEAGPGVKRYKALKSYAPAVGDRVMIINGVIVGGWVS